MSSEEISEATESTAHSILQYCITQAVLKNKSLNSKFQIPYNKLKKPSDAPFDDVSLQIEIKMSWERSADDQNVEIEYDE